MTAPVTAPATWRVYVMRVGGRWRLHLLADQDTEGKLALTFTPRFRSVTRAQEAARLVVANLPAGSCLEILLEADEMYHSAWTYGVDPFPSEMLR